MTRKKGHGKPWRQRGIKGGCVTGKIRFATLAHARAELKRAKYSDDPIKRQEIRAYVCRLCAGAHLTSQTRDR